MFGQVRQLPQGPRQSHVTDGDQILEKRVLLVRDLIPAEQLRFHYSFGKRHVGSDRGYKSNKKVAQKVSRKQFSLSLKPLLRFLRIQLLPLPLPLPMPPILAFATEDWCSWLRRRVICCPGRCLRVFLRSQLQTGGGF